MNTPHAEHILRDQADELMGHSLVGSIGPMVGASLLWGIFYYMTRQPAILVWAALIHAIQVVRFVMNFRYISVSSEERQPLRSIVAYRRMLITTGVIWGLASWMFFPNGNLPLTGLMLLMLLGMVATRLGWLSSYRPALFWFIVPILGMLAGSLFWQADALHVGFAVITLAFMATNLRLGFKKNQQFTEALQTRYEKEDLANQLAHQLKIVEQASLEKTRFFASASHDLRQPLHSLGLFGSAILARMKGTPDEPLARNLMICVDALETSFTSMLDVSKLDAGVVMTQPQVIALAELFKKLDISFGQQAQAEGLALRFKSGGKWVEADPLLLQRMLANLVHNALKFTRKGGVAIVARSDGQMVSVEVWDTGVGIAAQDMPRIFDEFYQVGNLERDRSKGLGMGLAIVQRLSVLLNIPIQVKSRLGRGTVIKLALPSASPSQQLSAQPQHGNSGALRALVGLRVLVVDDEEAVRTSTAVAMRLYGLQVEVADGIEQALSIAKRIEEQSDSTQKLAALVTDFRLRNEEDGITLAALLKAQLGREIATLLVTGDTAPQRVREAQASGLRVLYKPIKIHVLVEELRLQIGLH